MAEIERGKKEKEKLFAKPYKYFGYANSEPKKKKRAILDKTKN